MSTKRKIIISLILEILIFATLITCTVFATIENGISSEDLPSLTPVGGDAINEVTYYHNGRFIRRDGENDIRYITEQQLASVQDWLDEAYSCSGGNEWWNCGNHAKAWTILKEYHVFTQEEYEKYEGKQNDFQEKYLGKENGKYYLKNIITDIFSAEQQSECTISALLSYLNNTSSNPVAILEKFSSVFCLRHNQDVPGWTGTFGGPSIETTNTFTANDYIESFVPDRTIRYASKVTDVVTMIDGEDSTKAGWDYMEKDSVTTTTSKSHITYFATDMNDQSLRDSLYNGFDTYTTNVFSYAASFSEKLKPEPGYLSGNYDLERAQNAIWEEVGSGTKNDSGAALYDAALSVDQFEELVADKGEEPEIKIITDTEGDVTSGKNVGEYKYEPTGTTITVNSNNQVVYRIGPFSMSAYALGANDNVPKYSGLLTSVDDKLVGGIIYGQLNLDNGNHVVIGHNVKVDGSTNSFNRLEDNEIASHAKIIYAENNVSYAKSNLYKPTSYDYPYPESIFYIEVPVDSCGDATTLDSVTFYYRKTSTEGHGWVITGKYAECTWEPRDKTTGCKEYYVVCDDCGDDIEWTATIQNVDTNTPVTIEWEHKYSDNCGNACTGSCGSDSEGNPTSCGTCCDGDHDCIGSDTGVCVTHDYERCQKFNWLCTNAEGALAQPFLAIHDACTKVDFYEKTYSLDVRLTVDVTIDKYIYKVEHTKENTDLTHSAAYTTHDNTYDSEFENENRLSNKESSVKLERGDKVTYKIVLSNDSNIDVKAQIKDELPEYCILKDISVGTFYLYNEKTDGTYDDNKFFITEWVTVPANDTATVTVEIIATASDAEIENKNTATLVSGNAGRNIADTVDNIPIKTDDEINYLRVTSGPINGAVVNNAQIEKDANGNITGLAKVLEDYDEYTVKSYSIVLDKYITKVEHTTTGEVTYERYAGAKNISDDSWVKDSTNYTDRDKYNNDSSKQNAPIVVEYGDRVTYDIDIQNTWSANNFEMEQHKNGIHDTIMSHPYYAPNYVHVDVTDVLPDCYEEGSLEVEYIIYETGYGNNLDGKGSTTNTPGTTNYIEKTIELDPEVENKVFTVPDLYINPNSEATLRVSYIVNTNKVGTLFENNVYLNDAGEVKDDNDNIKGEYPGSNYGSELSYEIRNINNYYVYNATNKEENGVKAPLRVDTSDYFILNDYNVDIETYITDYREEMLTQNTQSSYEVEADNFSVEGLETWDGTASDNKAKTRRRVEGNVSGMNDGMKAENPVQVEKNETLQYTIRLYNNSTSETGKDNEETEIQEYYYKPATTVRTSSVKVTLDDGLALYTGDKNSIKVKATIYSSVADADNKTNGNSVNVNISSDSTYNVFYFNIANKYSDTKEGSAPDKDYTLLQPGSVIEYTMDVQVVKSNMYLENIENNAQIHILTDVNNTMTTGTENSTTSNNTSGHSRVVTQRNLRNSPSIYADVDNDTFTYPSSSDYVKLKDLIIAGRVWLDKDKDGYMGVENSAQISGTIKQDDSREIVYDDETSEKAMEGIVVKLYRAGETDPVATTRTNSQGLYTFAKDENGAFKGGLSQRIQKANANGYIDYYVEFEYDGVTYKSTEVYGGSNSLEDNWGQGNLAQNWFQLENIDTYYNNDYVTTPVASDVYLKYDTILTPSKYFLQRTYTNENYKYDSNAYEFKDVREKFNKNYETVTYNYAYATDADGKASTSNGGAELKFTKDGHTSYLNINHERVMKARSFIKRNSNASLDNTDELWLYYNTYTNSYSENGTNALPETEYLKYINLGLEEREDIDISLTKDVYEVKTTINGEEMTYSYDQNKGVNGQMEADGYLQNYEVGKPYGLTLYESDFKYRAEQYENQAVKDYKGEESELNIEVTYRIRVDSTAFTDDEPFMDDKNRELETTVHEIVDLYDENFVKYNDNPHEYIRLREKDEDDIFKEDDKEIKIAEAWCYDNGGNKVELTLSNSSKYLNATAHATKDNDFTSSNNTGYNTLYITGMDTPHTKIDEGGHLDIYVKYVVDKDEKVDTREETIDGNTATVHTLKGELKIGNDDLINNKETENIAQINSYSIWYEDGKPTSIVDSDSNAGNVGENNEGTKVSPDDTDYYEDTVYKTEINITSPNSPNEPENIGAGDGEGELSATNPIIPIRTITGKVWDDARTQPDNDTEKQKNQLKDDNGISYTNYSGDGLYKSTFTDEDGNEKEKEKKPEAMANENVEKNYKDASVTEKKDIEVRSAKVEYVEIVAMRSGSDIIYYEEKLDKDRVPWEPVQNDRTEDDGTYELTGLIPGYYIVRYTYGDSIIDEIVYDSASEAQRDMLIFNGQDYKSTKYTGTSDVATEAEKTDKDLREDRIVKEMEEKDKSDAKDDEIKRLETIAYSETMVNQRAEILKGLANGTVTDDDSNSTEQLKSLTDNTYMYADTVQFYVKPEKLETNTNPDKLDIRDEYTDYVSNGIAYAKQKHLEFGDTFVSSRTFNIKNLDFGIEYRPESQITLNKEVSAISLITSDGEELVRLALRTINFGEGSLQEHEVIEEESIGLEYTQFISNDYITINPYALTSEDYQGFIFINVDDDILQGSTIKIDYRFVAENNSEVDFVSNYLDTLRYRENLVTEEYNEYKDLFAFSNLNEPIGTYNGLYLGSAINAASGNKFVYTAAGTARNLLYQEYYDKDSNGSIYRKKELKTYDITEDENGVQKKSDADQISDIYYGRYLSKFYYLGEVGTEDVIASLKFDKVLDYVDTDLVFRENPAEKEKNKLWTTSTDNELKGIFVHEKSFTEQAITVSGLLDSTEELIDKQLVNSKGVSYVTYQKEADNTVRPLTSNLVISVDDRVTDMHDDNINESLSRYLLPYWEEETDGIKITNAPDSRGNIILPVSKVISAEADTDDLQYENIAEVIQFTSQTGRRTNYATTIGNAAVTTGEFLAATTETDTTATEVITLTPPTGLDRLNRVVRDTVETAGMGIGITVVAVALVVAGFVIVRFTIKKIKKRRIK